jgi:Zn finger protein HypA/HybF involved in hydrogenase expression
MIMDKRPQIVSAPRQIECLCCGAERVMLRRDAGECPGCHYLGWTYSDDLDGTTQRLIVNRVFGVKPVLALNVR